MQEMDQGSHQHYNRAGFYSRIPVDSADIKLFRRCNLDQILTMPFHLYSYALQYFYDSVNFFYTRDTMQGCGAPVEQRRAKQTNRAVLGKISPNGSAQLPPAFDLKINR